MQPRLGWPTWMASSSTTWSGWPRSTRRWACRAPIRGRAGSSWTSTAGPFEILERSELPEYDARRFQVGFDVADIEAARDALIAAGAEAISRIHGGPASSNRWCYMRDPEGNVFEITQRQSPAAGKAPEPWRFDGRQPSPRSWPSPASSSPTREAEHNLIFGICSQIEADPTQYPEPPYLAAVLDGDRVVGARRSGRRRGELVLSVMDDPAAVDALVDGPRRPVDPGRRRAVPSPPARSPRRGAGSPACKPTAGQARAGVSAARGPARRRPAPGTMVRADASHRTTLRAWVEAFHDEAIGPGGAPPQDFEAMTDRWVRGLGRTPYLWVDEGRPVSLAGVGGLTPNGIRVGPVYTPPELRGRGYASNLVARRVAAPARCRPDVRLPVHGPRQPDGEQDLPGHRLRARDRHRRVQLRAGVTPDRNASGHRRAVDRASEGAETLTDDPGQAGPTRETRHVARDEPAATSTPCRAGRPDRARHVRRVRLPPRAERNRGRGALVPLRPTRWPRCARRSTRLPRGPPRSERPADPRGLASAPPRIRPRRRLGLRSLGEPARGRLARHRGR